jgi:hypothetical protein
LRRCRNNSGNFASMVAGSQDVEKKPVAIDDYEVLGHEAEA